MTFPRCAHVIYLDEPIPAERQACIDSFQAHHPGWELKVWRTLGEFGPLHNQAVFDQAKEVAGPHNRHQVTSNCLRFELMFRYGGLFFDTDVLWFKSVDPIIERMQREQKSGMLAWEIQDKWLGEAVIASVPGAPFMERIVRNLQAWAFKRKGKPPTITVGPQFITPLLKGSPELADVLVMPQVTFFPARHNQPELGDRIARGIGRHPDTVGIHGFFNFKRQRGLYVGFAGPGGSRAS